MQGRDLRIRKSPAFRLDRNSPLKSSTSLAAAELFAGPIRVFQAPSSSELEQCVESERQTEHREKLPAF